MKKYLFLQSKRQLKVFPAVLAVTLIMFLGLGIIFLTLMHHNSSKEENTKFKVAITGDTENDYLQFGITAMQTLDDTRFSIEFMELTEDEAEKQLSSGDISAYVILPENFMENALAGFIDPIKYVTSPGNGGIVTMFKNEITKVVTDIVVYSEKGSYGIAEAIKDNDVGVSSNKYLNLMSIEYVDLILHRSDLIEARELGISSGLSTAQYYICGILILLLMLIGLPYASVGIRRDNSLGRLLISRGFSCTKQLICEWAAHFASLVALSLVLFAVAAPAASLLLSGSGLSTESSLIEAITLLCLRLIPVIMMVSAFNILFFEISDNLVSGIMLHFFTAVSLCYITGCFYPIYSFPVIIQKISAFLPTGIAREFLSGVFTDELSLLSLAGVAAYTALFFFASLAVRQKKMSANGGRSA